MSRVTTHVLDTARGAPARGLSVRLQLIDGNGVATAISEQRTDDDGRVKALHPDRELVPARYRLVFDTGSYLRDQGGGNDVFFPEVAIDFLVADATAHYHVPLLLSPFGYSTYRGS